MEDYKLKYLKYKKKYLNLKSKVGGADLTYDEQLKLALALSNAGDEVVPQGEAKKSLAEKQAESRARAEKAADDELQRVLRESAAEAERQMRASVPVAAAAPAVPQGKAKKSLAERQAESRARAEKAADDELQKALRDSAAEAERQKRDIGAAAAPAAAPLIPGGPIRVNVARISQMDFPKGRSACTSITAETAHWILKNERIPTIFEYENIIRQVAGNYTSGDGSDFSDIVLSNQKYLGFLPYMGEVSGNTRGDYFSEITKYYDTNEFICIAITKRPETILICFNPNEGIFLLDSHPVPHLGLEKASILQFNTVEDLIGFLRKRFPITERAPELNEYVLRVVNKK